MSGSGRNWSCMISKTWDQDGKKMFEEIFKFNISSSDLKAVVTVGKKVEISFLSERALRNFVAVVPEQWGCTHELEDDVTVTISPMFGSGHTYVEDGVLRTALERKGKVISGKRCVYVECPNVENGIRMFKMKDVEGLGGSLRFGGAVFRVQYKGQTKRCFHCQSTEHEAKECENRLCFKCEKGGHKAEDCREDPVCSACGETGHVHRRCGKSYANRCKLISNDWLVFDGDDKPFEDVMAADQSKIGDREGTKRESVDGEGRTEEGNICSGLSTITTLDLRISTPGSEGGEDVGSQDLFSGTQPNSLSTVCQSIPVNNASDDNHVSDNQNMAIKGVNELTSMLRSARNTNKAQQTSKSASQPNKPPKPDKKDRKKK